MSTNAPLFPGEEIISLSAAIITQNGCANVENAFDNDPSTASHFTQPGAFIERKSNVVTVVGTNANFIDTGVVLAPGEVPGFIWDGANVIDFGLGSGWQPEGNSTSLGIPGYRCSNVWGLGMVAVVRPDGTGPPVGTISDGIPYDYRVYPGKESGPAQLPIASGGRIWLIANDNDYTNNSGSWTIRVVAYRYDTHSRFVRAEWGTDRFVSRVRLRMSGSGAINAAIAFVSGLSENIDPIAEELVPTGFSGGDLLMPSGYTGVIGPGNDVPIPYIPLPSDENFVFSGDANTSTGVDEIILDLPALATGVVFYPDFLARSAAETGDINLYQLQIYAEKEETMPTNPTQTTTEWSQVGVQSMIFYPYNGVTGPYDATTGSKLSGLQSLDCGETITTAKITGGETSFQLGAHETGREIKLKFSASIANLRVLAILEGGTLVVNPPSGSLGEVQYHRPSKSDRAPYFRFAAVSSNGDGKLTLVFFKCKMDGALSYNLNKDQVSNLEGDFSAYYDGTAVCADGAIGGVRDILHGGNFEDTFHS